MQIFENHEQTRNTNAAQHCLEALSVLEATYALEIQKQELQIARLRANTGDDAVPPAHCPDGFLPDFVTRRRAA
jgi:hypothetical protein